MAKTLRIHKLMVEITQFQNYSLYYSGSERIWRIVAWRCLGVALHRVLSEELRVLGLAGPRDLMVGT